jgi:SAM-dependent methyltransferase
VRGATSSTNGEGATGAGTTRAGPTRAGTTGAGTTGAGATGAVDRHRQLADDALESGDPDRIKALYRTLGDDLWDQHASDPAAAPVLSLPATAGVVASLLDGVSGGILDAGCGPNPAVSRAIAANARGRGAMPTFVLVDMGLGTVRLARAVTVGDGITALGVVADVEALPFRRGAFDAVVCDDTIEHVPDDHVAVVELARVAATGARVVIATPNRRNARIILAKLRDRLRGDHRPAADYFLSNSHLREYAWGEFERLARTALRLDATATVGWDGNHLHSRIGTALVRRRPWRRLGQMIVVRGSPR